jgi:nonribosomal peptide synthetase DhbF
LAWRGVKPGEWCGQSVEVKILPRPVQAELPVWLTGVQNPKTFETAGKLGVNILTALLSQTIPELAKNISIYHRALEEHGHDPATRTVTVMLHTFVDESHETAVQMAREPLRKYFRSHTNLRRGVMKDREIDLGLDSEDFEKHLSTAVERYLKTSSLIGSPATCLGMIDRLKGIGVNEIACLIDFGVGVETVLGSLPHLARLAEKSRYWLGTEKLRADLRERLPKHMVPGPMVIMDKLPLTPDGKLDRKGLPAPEWQRRSGYVEPRNRTEELLCSVFCEALSIERIGVEENFFELGGHSLLATRLISRIRAMLGVELSVRILFETPTVAGLAEQLAHAQAARPAPRSFPRPAQVPLSFAQRRLWFLDRLEGPSPTYNIPVALRLSGPLDCTALESALGDLVERHESLRTLFPEIEGTPHQLILEPANARPKLRVQLVTEATLAEALSAAARQSFELSSEIPLRAHLFTLSQSEQVLLLVLHQIAGDGWSMAPLGRDMARAYAARSQGKRPEQAALPVQYADYTLWQRQVLGSETDLESPIARQIAFWTKTLEGLPEQLELPTDRPRPATASYRGQTVPLQLGSELHCRLLVLAREHQVSLFMVLQAALATLLTRLGAGSDIPIGSPIAGRTDSALEEMVGFFVNTLVLRTDTSANPTFSELLARVRNTDLAAYAHQDLPFERLVELLNPARSLSRHPLFQVMLAFQNAPEARLELPGMVATPEPITTNTAKFDLSFSLGERYSSDGASKGITGAIQYSSDLFERSTIEAIARRLARLLEAVATDPAQPIGRLELLAPEEREQILVEWNDTGRPVPDATLPALFEAQVRRGPEAGALVFEESTLTYGELNVRANRLAHLLIGQGIGPETLVALALPRSMEMVVGLLAILKSGAAYLPLDPEYPAERLAFMLKDATPACVLTTGKIAHRLPNSLPRLFLDHPATAIALARSLETDPTQTERTQPLSPLNPAYVIYTSGSTGTPKGVVNTHGAIVNRLLWMQSAYELKADDRILQKTSAGFDVSVWEFF